MYSSKSISATPSSTSSIWKSTRYRRMPAVQVHRFPYSSNCPMRTANAAEAADELRALLALVSHNFKCRAELFIVIGEPLKNWHRLDQFQFDARLHEKCVILATRVVFLTSGSTKCVLSFSWSGRKCSTLSVPEA